MAHRHSGIQPTTQAYAIADHEGEKEQVSGQDTDYSVTRYATAFGVPGYDNNLTGVRSRTPIESSQAQMSERIMMNRSEAIALSDILRTFASHLK